MGPAGDAWPAFLPVSGAHRHEKGPNPPAVAPGHRVPGTGLPTLLSRALMSFRAEFERESAVSLPVSANTLRVLSADGVALGDVPRLAGVSREAVSLSVGRLERRLAVTGPDPAGGRGSTSASPRAASRPRTRTTAGRRIGDGWRARYGDGVIDGLAGALRALYARAGRAGSAADLSRAGALPRRLAGPPALPAADPGHDRRPGRGPPPLPDGDPPRRLPRRQLTAGCRSPVGQCST